MCATQTAFTWVTFRLNGNTCLSIHKLILSLFPPLYCLPDSPCCSLSLSSPALWTLLSSVAQDAGPVCLSHGHPSASVLQTKPDMLHSVLEMMSFLFLRGQAVGSTPSSLTWAPANLCAHHNTTIKNSQQGHSVLALSSRELHMPAELITLTAAEIILAHHWPSEMNISIS